MQKPLILGTLVAAAIVVIIFFPLLYLLGFFIAVLSVFYVFTLMVADSDLTLLLYEKFGSKGDNLQSKVIWITGASNGIGKYLALHLAEKGAKLVLSARNEENLQEVKKQCLLNYPGEESDIYVLPLDVTEFESHKKLAQKILQHFSTIDILINNAGRSQRGLVEETILDIDKALLDVNLLGPISITKAVLPIMLNQGHGHIVNISSVAGRMGTVFAATYSATKHALHGYFEAAQMELFGKNIHFTNVCPGPVVSSIVENAIQKDFDQTPLKNADGYGERSFWFLLSAERCAELTTVAIANKLGEAWIGKSPILLLCYVAYYLPQLFMFAAKRFGMKRAEKLVEAQMKGK